MSHSLLSSTSSLLTTSRAICSLSSVLVRLHNIQGVFIRSIWYVAAMFNISSLSFPLCVKLYPSTCDEPAPQTSTMVKRSRYHKYTDWTRWDRLPTQCLMCTRFLSLITCIFKQGFLSFSQHRRLFSQTSLDRPRQPSPGDSIMHDSHESGGDRRHQVPRCWAVGNLQQSQESVMQIETIPWNLSDIWRARWAGWIGAPNEAAHSPEYRAPR